MMEEPMKRLGFFKFAIAGKQKHIYIPKTQN